MRYFIVTGAILVGLYMALRPFDEAFQQAGMSAFVLANVLYMSGSMWWNLPSLRDRSSSVAAITNAVTLSFAVIAGLFLMCDPLWIQRLFSAYLAFRAGIFAFALFCDPEWLGDLPWHARYWDSGRENAARWEIVGAVMMLLLNEVAIAYGTLDQWMVVRVVSPALVYALKWWTICLTHPFENEDEV
ncbi:MAG: hypothetical protein AAGA87_12325 [Pseudomonadota bacterium]